MKRGAAKRKKGKKDLKIVEKCVVCGNDLPKYSVHHKRCKKCWEKRQIEKGNLALIGGVK